MATPLNPFDQFDAPVAAQPTANPFDRFDVKPKGPVKAVDRLQATEGGILKGAAYLATMPADVIANAGELGQAALGTAYGIHPDSVELPGKTPGGLYHFMNPQGFETYSKNAPPPGSKPVTETHPRLESILNPESGPSPVGNWLTQWMDKSPITTTQPTRPEDAPSRYLSTLGSVVPGVIAGSGGSIPQTLRAFSQVAPGAAAGQYVAEKRPFQSDAANTAASIGAQLLTTALMPRGRGEPLPQNEPINQAVTQGQEAGYEFPPATTNPSPLNRTLTTIAGKQNLREHASLNNQGVTNEGFRVDMGWGEGNQGPVTEAEIEQARTEAAPGYDALRGAGQIPVSQGMRQQLTAALRRSQGASRMAPSLGSNQLENIVHELGANQAFDAGDAMDTMAELRDRASVAYRAGSSGEGAAYRAASNAIENAIDQHLSNATQGRNPQIRFPGDPDQLLQDYRNSRQQFARIATYEDARNVNTGNINAQKLAKALQANEPLSGRARIAGQAAGQDPLAFKEPLNSPGAHHLGLWGSIGAGALAAHEYLPGNWGVAGAAGAAAIPASRYLARQLALGGLGQGNALPRAPLPLQPGTILGTYPSAVSQP